MALRRFVIQADVDASGDATVYSPYFNGHIHSIRYVKDDFADGVDFTITEDVSGETVWAEENVNASATRYPRAPTHSTAGVAALYAAGGTGVLDRIAVDGGRLKFVVANGGTSTSGSFHVLVDG